MAIITAELFIRAVGMRLIFFAHAVVCTWRVVSVYDSIYLWCMLLIPLLLLPECVLTLKFTKYGEWQTFRPCIFIYIASVVSNVWLMEYEILQGRITGPGVDGIMCSTKYTEDNELGNLFRRNASLIDGLEDFFKEFSSDNWAITVQQFLMFFLIAGRWILPSHGINGNKMANIVLLHVVMAADILEFLSAGLRSDEGVCLESVLIGVMVLWTVSLLQFPIYFDTTEIHRLSAAARSALEKRSTLNRFARSKVWEIVTVMILQDGPFICMRLFFLFYFKIFSQASMFFIGKNFMYLIIEAYRLWALLCVKVDEDGNRNSTLITSIRETLRRPRSTGSHPRDHKTEYNLQDVLPIDNVAPNEEMPSYGGENKGREIENGVDIEMNGTFENISPKSVEDTENISPIIVEEKPGNIPDFSRINIEDKPENIFPSIVEDKPENISSNSVQDKPENITPSSVDGNMSGSSVDDKP
ncbi:transmembrane protein 26-like [Amphiura filiformis]|uniref:transmembrane protein 26-like n=1 Tax=Amphiura filiformis TaxID=82378 RepID=UPI003B2241C8